MRIDDFDYQLPTHLIAQEPLPVRDRSRLMVVRRETGVIEHRYFYELPELLATHDLLVLNDTKVVPARLIGKRARTGGKWEGLFIRKCEGGAEWLCQAGGKLAEGEIIEVEPSPFQLRLMQKTSAGTWIGIPVRPVAMSIEQFLMHAGRVPLPPYIRKGVAEPSDVERYQTVYASSPGAVAAPTAGLHFTPALFGDLDRRSIGRAFVTLHVGVGTFQPIKVDDVAKHAMHAEWGQIEADAVRIIENARMQQGRVIAVGTTAVRVLEASATKGVLEPRTGDIDLYIFPPYEFQIVDALITNFHLPRSTLLLLVSAFGGTELIRRAYQEAIAQAYRFYSYGDAMLIL